MQNRQAQMFHELNHAEQLFLWSARHLVQATSRQLPYPKQFTETLKVAGLTTTLPLLDLLFSSLAKNAQSSIVLNSPKGIEILLDEQGLMAYFSAKLHQPDRCACRYLLPLIPGDQTASIIFTFDQIIQCYRLYQYSKEQAQYDTYWQGMSAMDNKAVRLH